MNSGARIRVYRPGGDTLWDVHIPPGQADPHLTVSEDGRLWLPMPGAEDISILPPYSIEVETA